MTTESSKKKVVVFFCGLAGVGKRTLIDRLRKRIPNSAKFEKDLISDSILGGLDHTTPEYQIIKDRIYRTLAGLAIDNLENGNTTAILQAYYGDKLTKTGTVEYITSEDYEVKIVYAHCSAGKQIQRLKERGATRDGDKIGSDANGNDKFPPYRLVHIKNHLRELSQVSNFLILDTEDDAILEVNVDKIIEYINTPTARIEIHPIANKIYLESITLEDSFGGCAKFIELLNKIQPSHNSLMKRDVTAEVSNDTTSDCLPSFTAAFRFTRSQAVTDVLGLLTSSAAEEDMKEADHRPSSPRSPL